MTQNSCDVRREFEMRGLSIAQWARENDFSPSLVYRVLKGEGAPLRGQSHVIAVRLGLKEGLIGKNERIFTSDLKNKGGTRE